jgi:hypothetical protein
MCLQWQQWTKTQYGLMTLAYQRFTAVLLLIYGSLYPSGIYCCLSALRVLLQEYQKLTTVKHENTTHRTDEATKHKKYHRKRIPHTDKKCFMELNTQTSTRTNMGNIYNFIFYI